MSKIINQAIVGFLLLTFVESVLSFPTIAQSIAEPASLLRIKVIGGVQRPGSYIVTSEVCHKDFLRKRYQDNNSERINQYPTISRAIQIAGGIIPVANVRQISIHHLQANHGSQITNIDLWQFLRFGGLTQDLLLQDGDTITIPTVPSTAFVQAPQETSTNFATNITVLGDVVHPGNFILPANATLKQALLAAGSLKSDRASRKNIVVVLHLNPNGSTTHQVANLNLPQKSEAAKPLVVQNNDIVVISSGRIRSLTTNVLDLFSDLQLLNILQEGYGD